MLKNFHSVICLAHQENSFGTNKYELYNCTMGCLVQKTDIWGFYQSWNFIYWGHSMESPGLCGSKKPKSRFLKYCRTLKRGQSLDLPPPLYIVNSHYNQSCTCSNQSHTYNTPKYSLTLIENNF